MTMPDGERVDLRLQELAARLRQVAGLSGIAEHGSLAPHTTWRVGGAADLLCEADDVDGLATAVQLAVALDVPWRVLGRGSNVLVGDQGVDGLVILNRASHLLVEGSRVTAESGLLLSTLAQRAARAGLAGMEWSAGIPGSVGGALVSNAGAHGGCMADTVRQVELLDPAAGRRWEPVSALRLAYRHSRLREAGASPEIVLRAIFALRPEDPGAIRRRMDQHRLQRQTTQPLASASAGSVFKNPPGESAARLIDQAGLKGTCIGGATVSERHANFVVTKAGARASDVQQLVELVRVRVRERYDIDLVLEVQPIGRKAPDFA